MKLVTYEGFFRRQETSVNISFAVSTTVETRAVCDMMPRCKNRILPDPEDSKSNFLYTWVSTNQYSVISQNTWMSINITIRTSNFTSTTAVNCNIFVVSLHCKTQIFQTNILSKTEMVILWSSWLTSSSCGQIPI